MFDSSLNVQTTVLQFRGVFACVSDTFFCVVTDLSMLHVEKIAASLMASLVKIVRLVHEFCTATLNMCAVSLLVICGILFVIVVIV